MYKKPFFDVTNTHSTFQSANFVKSHIRIQYKRSNAPSSCIYVCIYVSAESVHKLMETQVVARIKEETECLARTHTIQIHYNRIAARHTHTHNAPTIHTMELNSILLDILPKHSLIPSLWRSLCSLIPPPPPLSPSSHL